MKTLEEIEALVKKYDTFQVNSVFSMEDMFKRYLEYCKNIDGNKALTGIESIDKSLGGIRPGELMCVVAPTNAGKTSFAMMSAKATAAMMPDKIIPVICTEPTEIDMIERYLQQELNKFTFEVEELCKDLSFDSKSGSEIFAKLKKYANIIHVVKALKENEIIPYVKMLEELTEKKAGFVIIDHVQGMKASTGVNKAEKLEHIVSEMKQAVNTLMIPALFVSHTSRHDVKDKKELGLYSGKGSGEIENSAQIYFTLELETDMLGVDAETEKQLCTAENPRNKYKMLKLTPHKKKRGYAEAVRLLMDTKTTEIKEYSAPPIF